MPDPSHPLLLKVEQPVLDQFLELAKKIDKENPAPAQVQALRDMLNTHPDLWRAAADLSRTVILDIVKRVSDGPVIAESLKRASRAIQEDLGYPTASPLERLMIEQVVVCWLHLHIVQVGYNDALTRSTATRAADRWERRLSAVQLRYIRACDALARIRKLARATSALQVNIAAHGGQQVNLLADEPP